MKNLNWFDRSPQGDSLSEMARKGRLKLGEQVAVNDVVYRYAIERGGTEHVLLPVESPKR